MVGSPLLRIEFLTRAKKRHQTKYREDGANDAQNQGERPDGAKSVDSGAVSGIHRILQHPYSIAGFIAEDQTPCGYDTRVPI